MSNEDGCFTTTWVIENFSLFETARNGNLMSPSWTQETDQVNETLQLIAQDTGPSILFKPWSLSLGFRLYDRCEISLVSTYGEVPLERGCKENFFLNKKAIFVNKRESYLPGDTLTVCFRLWEKKLKTRETCVGSVLRNGKFLWNIRSFHPLIFNSNSFKENKDFLFFASIVDNDKKGGTHTVIVRGEVITERCHFASDCKLTVKEGKGRVICHESKFDVGNCFGEWRWDVEIVKEKRNSNWIENLQLILECVAEVHKNDLPVHSSLKHDKDKAATEPVLDSPGTLANDLLLLFRERTLTDAVLNTDKKTFLAHRNILAARSRVFRDRFEGEHATESSPGLVDIKDVDSETLDRLLFFMYTDSVQGVKWDEACALYNAAGKYAVHFLKQKCVDILKASLSMDNVCEVLVLADKHSDDVLMNCSVNFIRDHQEVISMPQWENLENSNLRLAAKITREILLKKGNN